ncbi:MAG: cation diffusion facilitator family transporter [Acidimicrobiales bacterium]|nr:cation diffusion facilitator family transporter [Acidimicrobiales bacterium]
MAAEHDHGAAGHTHGPHRETQRRALWISLVANAGFLIAEVAGGIVFHSLALLADAAHMTADVVGLTIALVAQRLLSRPATDRHSYGFQRAEVLGGQLNGLALLAVSAWIVYEAIRRIGEPAHVRGGGMLVVATLGLLVNVGCAILLGRARGRSVNMRGAYLHMVVDAAGSVAAIVAGVAVVTVGANWVDPVASVVIALLVVWSAWGLLKETTNVMLEAAPGDIAAADVEAALLAEPDVSAVHHCHIWSLASDVAAFSAHIVIEDADTLHDAQKAGTRLKAMLSDRFNIDHATLELECHPCTEPEAQLPHGP